MKKIILSILGIVLLSSFCFAETITLKSGITVEATIFQRTEDYIKAYVGGDIVTYNYDEIESIDGQPIGGPVQEPITLIEEETEQTQTEEPAITPLGPPGYDPSAVSGTKTIIEGKEWYESIKGYLAKVDEILTEIGEYQQQMGTTIYPAKISGDEELVEKELGKVRDQIGLYLNQLDALTPPPELMNYHAVIRRSLENNIAMISAAMQGKTQEVLRYTAESIALGIEGYEELRSAFIENNAPQEEIERVENLIKLLEGVLGY